MNKLNCLFFDKSTIPTYIPPIKILDSNSAYGMWGTGLESRMIINDYITNNIISDISNLDIITIYGFEFTNPTDPKISNFISFINKNVKTCKSIIFDLQGEGQGAEQFLKYFDDFREKLKLKDYTPKILWNLNKKVIYKDYDIFYHKYYHIAYWDHVKNINNSTFQNKLKRTYNFSFLNGKVSTRPHRYNMLKMIYEKFDTLQPALISNLDKSVDIPYMKIAPIGKINLYASAEEEIRDSYINLVSETDHKTNGNLGLFLTEKSLKPFLYQQIPLFLAPPGTVAHYKEIGFDLFDDIIDHAYDVETDLDNRCKLVFNQLLKAKNIDFETYFKINEYRLRHNYDLYQNIISHATEINTQLIEWILK
jgi:hypothetical protein